MLENYDKSLYDRLIAAARDDKLVVLDTKLFEHINEVYGRDTFRDTLSEYIANERPVFPLKEITKDDMRNCFYELQNLILVKFAYQKIKLKKKYLKNMMTTNIHIVIMVLG